MTRASIIEAYEYFKSQHSDRTSIVERKAQQHWVGSVLLTTGKILHQIKRY